MLCTCQAISGLCFRCPVPHGSPWRLCDISFRETPFLFFFQVPWKIKNIEASRHPLKPRRSGEILEVESPARCAWTSWSPAMRDCTETPRCGRKTVGNDWFGMCKMFIGEILGNGNGISWDIITGIYRDIIFHKAEAGPHSPVAWHDTPVVASHIWFYFAIFDWHIWGYTAFRSILCSLTIWRFPEIGLPLNHGFL